MIDTGDAAWGVPAYNGGLFGSDPELHPDGATLARVVLRNDALGPALMGLLVEIAVDETRGPVDFRSLDVRDFGTIYEGLLESGLSVAAEDLTVDAGGAWRPARASERVDAPKDSPYFHTKAGDRKATGTYFTKPFAVEHLLERALDPAVDAHLEKVGALVATGDQVGAARLFFDLRVADLAMGSGHFLVAAIGHIEAKFGAFLERNAIPGVERELLDLREAAAEALNRVGIEDEIDRSALLGRQIARRCIYGLDINDIAVELARLAIWVRTLVPGLPMSSLDHQLVCANSLTGIGTIDEAVLALDPDTPAGALTFSGQAIRSALESARSILEDAAALKESTSDEARVTQAAARRALDTAQPARLLFDTAVAVRLGVLPLPAAFDAESIVAGSHTKDLQDLLVGLSPAHFPVQFPEVFLREPPGFDVVLGNPPWEKVKVEAHSWWALRFPGIRSLPTKERDRRIRELRSERPDLVAAYESEVLATDALRTILRAGPYPGIGSGDIDLYKAFAWRDWHVTRDGGRLGLVLPRAAVIGSGTAGWRQEIAARGSFESVVVLSNLRHWVFEGIHEQNPMIALLSIRREPSDIAQLAGPFFSQTEFLAGRDDLATVRITEMGIWSPTLAFPLIPTADAGAVFRKMRAHPPFDDRDGFEFRPVRELDATNDRALFGVDLDRPQGDVPVLAGASFNIWNPNFGVPYGFADADQLEAHLLAKARAQVRHADSPLNGLHIEREADLPMMSARIAFRDQTNNTNQRTTIACLIPPGSRACPRVRRTATRPSTSFRIRSGAASDQIQGSTSKSAARIVGPKPWSA